MIHLTAEHIAFHDHLERCEQCKVAVSLCDQGRVILYQVAENLKRELKVLDVGSVVEALEKRPV
jgi:hypothetical protein